MFRTRLFFIALLGLAPFLCHANPSGGTQLLIGLWPTSAEQAAKVCAKVGTLAGKDRDSGMYVLKLRAGLSSEKAIAELKGNREVRFVLPESARHLNRDSYKSVDSYVNYLHASEALHGDDEADQVNQGKVGPKKTDKADYYEAWRHFLRTRSDASGNIDFAAIRNARLHKHAMPKFQLGTHVQAPGSMNTNSLSGNWNFIGPNNLAIPYQIYYGTPPLSGRISALAIDPTTASTIYAASGGGGLWKSTNTGSTWTCISDVSPWIYGAVCSLAIDPTNDQIIYAGTGDYDGFYDGYNQGIMKSTDGGQTWTNLASNVSGIYNLAVSHIVVDPDNDQIITCTTGRGGYNSPNEGTGNVFRSTDGGTTWTSANLKASDYCGLTIGVPNSQGIRTYWAAASTPLNSTLPEILYMSTNQGATWTSVTPPDTTLNQNGAGRGDSWSIAASQVSATTLYALDTVGDAVYMTTNSGGSWTNMNSNGLPPPANQEDNWSQSTYDYYVATYPAPNAPAKELVFVGLITLAYTGNAGANCTWVDYGQSYQTNAIMHNDQHEFAFSPSNTSEVLVGNDGGVFMLSFSWSGSTPSISFSPLNAGLGISQFYQIAPHPTDTTQIIGGTQDNATPASIANSSGGTGNLADWQNLYAGDGGFSGWDISQGLAYTTADDGTVYLYQLSNIANGPYEVPPGGYDPMITPVDFIAPTVLSDDGTKLFLGTNVLNTCTVTASSPSFTAGSQSLTNAYLTTIATAPSNNSYLYTGGLDGEIWLSSNEGSSFTEIDNSSLPSGNSIGAISVLATNPNDVLVGYQNTGISHLYHSTNTGASTVVWTNVSGSGSTGLPDAPLNGIVRDPINPTTTWYVGTDVGVFMTTNGGSTWSDVNGNLPNSDVFDLKYAAGYLYAGTFGRGVWRVLIDAAVPSQLALSASSIVAGGSGTGTVTLSTAAGSGGQAVSLSSSNTAALQVPATVTVNNTDTTGQFTFTTSGVDANTSVTVTATSNGVSKTAPITVEAASLDTITETSKSLSGGVNDACYVYLYGDAGPSGAVVGLSSSNTSAATVPSTVTVNATKSSAEFLVAILPVASSTQVTITALYGSKTATGTITVNPIGPAPTALTFATNPRLGGDPDSATVTLAEKAGSNGQAVSLTSSQPSIVEVPSTFTVANGDTNGTFPFTTSGVNSKTSVTVTATANGVSATATLTVDPPTLNYVSATNGSVPGGSSDSCLVEIYGLAGSNGVVVDLSSSNTAAATVPASVTIPSGSYYASFKATTKLVSSNTSVTISATYGGYTVKTTITVTVPPIALTLATNPRLGGDPDSGTVTLGAAAGSGGQAVSLSSSQPSIVQVPPSITVADGSKTYTFPITTTGVNSTTVVTITASESGNAASATLTVDPPTLNYVSAADSTVASNSTDSCLVEIYGLAGSNGVVVDLSSSNTSAATVPATVKIASGSYFASFKATSLSVSSATPVTISASYGGYTVKTTITVEPTTALALAPSGICPPSSSKELQWARPIPGLACIQSQVHELEMSQ